MSEGESFDNKTTALLSIFVFIKLNTADASCVKLYDRGSI